MAAVVSPPNAPRFFATDAEGMNTLPDPRSPSPSTPLSRSDSTASGQHPDLSNEVATLSTKLVNAINHQANLDDALQAARHELEIARQHIVQLEAATKKHQELINGGLLVDKEDVDALQKEQEAEKNRLTKERADELKNLQKTWHAEKELSQKGLGDERNLRLTAEKELQSTKKDLEREQKLRHAAESERRKMEQEVEGLTAALFEEANGMVADARREIDASEKRNEQLRNQLRESENLLHSHQEQLQDLKAVVEKISSEKDENESNAQISTAPSTPGMVPHDKLNRISEFTSLTTPVTPGMEDMTPDQPLKLSHLISPVLRHDLTAYEDFKNLAKAAAKATPAPSRVASGSYGSVNVLGLATGSNKSSHSSSPGTPNFPGTFGSPLARDLSSSQVPALKDTSVYRRALAEDIEPTLRLDVAPGVNWMAKRTIMTSITSGNLVVEPMPAPVSKFRGPIFACALCGENRKSDLYARRHRFRTSEAEEAQRYPLCDHCLGRVRMTCDYIAFLRLIRDGHWHADSDEEIITAWEESVRLRERMFWQRIGGGVVPASVLSKDGLRSPTFSKTFNRSSDESLRSPKVGTVEDPLKAGRPAKRASRGKTEISPDTATVHAEPEQVLSPDQEKQLDDEAILQLHNEMRNSSISRSSGSQTVTNGDSPHKDTNGPSAETIDLAFATPHETPSKEMQRLSLTIPGSFE